MTGAAAGTSTAIANGATSAVADVSHSVETTARMRSFMVDSLQVFVVAQRRRQSIIDRWIKVWMRRCLPNAPFR
jgi:hypothetical protein